MAFTYQGFKGSIDSTNWATKVAPLVGGRYTVEKSADFQVSAVAGQTRTIAVAPGVAHGWGVTVTSDSEVQIQVPAPASGSVWYTICLRRTWSATAPYGSASIVAVAGTTARGVSGACKLATSNGGIEADQPLALVQTTAGSANIGLVVDIRYSGTGAGLAAAPEALAYLNQPGQMVSVDGDLMAYGKTPAGQEQWFMPDSRATRVPRSYQSPLYGSWPTFMSTGFRIGGGTRVNTTNGTGHADVAINAADFPNGILTVVMCNGDGNAGDHWPACTYTDRTQFQYRVFRPNGPAAWYTHRINFIVIGW